MISGAMARPTRTTRRYTFLRLQTALYPVRLADMAVRTIGDPRSWTAAMQREMWAVDKDRPVTNVRTLEEIVSGSVAERRFQTLLLLTFAGVAVGLAVIGIFGALVVRGKSADGRDPHSRLGASPSRILALVMRQAVAPVTAGLGLAGALALTRYLESLLFQVQRTDWRTHTAALILLSAVSLLAALIPARRGGACRSGSRAALGVSLPRARLAPLHGTRARAAESDALPGI
jgi:hypothetical protein